MKKHLVGTMANGFARKLKEKALYMLEMYVLPVEDTLAHNDFKVTGSLSTPNPIFPTSNTATHSKPNPHKLIIQGPPSTVNSAINDNYEESAFCVSPTCSAPTPQLDRDVDWIQELGDLFQDGDNEILFYDRESGEISKACCATTSNVGIPRRYGDICETESTHSSSSSSSRGHRSDQRRGREGGRGRGGGRRGRGVGRHGGRGRGREREDGRLGGAGGNGGEGSSSEEEEENGGGNANVGSGQGA